MSLFACFLTFLFLFGCSNARNVKIKSIDDNKSGMESLYIEDHPKDNKLASFIDRENLNDAISQWKLFMDLALGKERSTNSKRENQDITLTNNEILFELNDTIFEDDQTDNETLECSGVGIKMIKNDYFNRCSGKACIADEIVCNNITYSNSSFDAIEGDLTDCTISSFVCGDERIIFNETCHFQKFKCPNKMEYSPKEIDPKRIKECLNQVSCGAVYYGYEVFNYYCTTNRLKCNGEIVKNNSNLRPTDPNCKIVNIPCESVSSQSNCSSITTECKENWTTSVCKKQIDWSVLCIDGHIPLKLRSLICDDEEVLYDDSFNRSIQSCEGVRSVGFGDEIKFLPDKSGVYCRIVDLYCDGVYIPFLFEDIPNNCSVGHIFCFDKNNISDGCTNYNIGCNNGQCHYLENEYKCHRKCVQYGLGETCDCPINYKGKECQTERNIRCTFKIKSDTLNDCKNEKYSAIYPVCSSMNKNETFDIQGDLECWFPDGSVEQLNSTIVTNFEYEVIGDRFVLYKMENWTVMLKVFNFNKYFDLSASPQLKLNINQMTGKQLIDLSLNLSLLGEKWMPGGKVYTELKFYEEESPNSMSLEAMTNMMINIIDYKPRSLKKKSKIGAIIAGILAPLILVGIGAVVYIYLRKRKSSKDEYRLLQNSDSHERQN